MEWARLYPEAPSVGGWVEGGNTLPLKNLEKVTKFCQKKMQLTYQLISLELDVVQGSILPLWKEDNKTFPYI